MELSLQTPALLFPAISLLFLAYTNRFLALASLIRSLHAAYRTTPDDRLLEQIRNLRTRVGLVRAMQLFGVVAILLCVLAMFLLYEKQQVAGSFVFAAGMVSLMMSLLFSLREIQISVTALNVLLSDLEHGTPGHGGATHDDAAERGM
ncbi:MAG: DUF2721 domain-containing protein [Armatimonadetes bacterium]|nr:DUF2721 domain-containing protein [Armatimonadota bacterium]